MVSHFFQRFIFTDQFIRYAAFPCWTNLFLKNHVPLLVSWFQLSDLRSSSDMSFHTEITSQSTCIFAPWTEMMWIRSHLKSSLLDWGGLFESWELVATFQKPAWNYLIFVRFCLKFQSQNSSVWSLRYGQQQSSGGLWTLTSAQWIWRGKSQQHSSGSRQDGSQI